MKTVVLKPLSLLIALSIGNYAHADFKVIGDQAPPPVANVVAPNEVILDNNKPALTEAERLNKQVLQLQAELDATKRQLAAARQEIGDLKTCAQKVQNDLAQVENKLEKITLNFAFAKSDFIPSSETAKSLLENARVASLIDITGYTDNKGTVDANRKIALRRAEAAKKWLLVRGIEAKKITTAAKPGVYISSNETEDGRLANRRVEIDFRN